MCGYLFSGEGSREETAGVSVGVPHRPAAEAGVYGSAGKQISTYKLPLRGEERNVMAVQRPGHESCVWFLRKEETVLHGKRTMVVQLYHEVAVCVDVGYGGAEQIL
jgi:hypothetical protein